MISRVRSKPSTELADSVKQVNIIKFAFKLQKSIPSYSSLHIKNFGKSIRFIYFALKNHKFTVYQLSGWPYDNDPMARWGSVSETCQLKIESFLFFVRFVTLFDNNHFLGRWFFTFVYATFILNHYKKVTMNYHSSSKIYLNKAQRFNV